MVRTDPQYNDSYARLAGPACPGLGLTSSLPSIVLARIQQIFPGSEIIKTTLEKSRLSRKHLEGPSMCSLLQTYDCMLYFTSRCPWVVLSSRGRSLPNETSTEYGRSGLTIVQQAVLQALGGRYMARYQHNGRQEKIQQRSHNIYSISIMT